MINATGCLVRYVPEGADRDELLGLVRIGLKFDKHEGKKPGALSKLILQCARRAGIPYTFAKLLDELEKEAARRDLYGVQVSTIEKVDRIFELVTHHTKKGREQVTFKTIMNHLSNAKKILFSEIPACR